jgi:hypothetical protein
MKYEQEDGRRLGFLELWTLLLLKIGEEVKNPD